MSKASETIDNVKAKTQDSDDLSGVVRTDTDRAMRTARGGQSCQGDVRAKHVDHSRAHMKDHHRHAVLMASWDEVKNPLA